MNQRHLAVHEPQTHHVGGVVEVTELGEDLVALRVRPPTPFDAIARDELGDIGDRTVRRLQKHPVLDENRHHVHRKPNLTAKECCHRPCRVEHGSCHRYWRASWSLYRHWPAVCTKLSQTFHRGLVAFERRYRPDDV